MGGVEIALAFILTVFPSLGEAAAVTTAPSMADSTAMIGAAALNATDLEKTDSTAAGSSTTPSVHRSNRGKGMNLKGYKNVTTVLLGYFDKRLIATNLAYSYRLRNITG